MALILSLSDPQGRVTGVSDTWQAILLGKLIPVIKAEVRGLRPTSRLHEATIVQLCSFASSSFRGFGSHKHFCGVKPPRADVYREDAAKAFFSDELLERVTGLYGVRPSVEFVQIATLVENIRARRRLGLVSGREE